VFWLKIGCLLRSHFGNTGNKDVRSTVQTRWDAKPSLKGFLEPTLL